MVFPVGPGKFYGSSLPRPRIYTNVQFSDERVDPPTGVMESLMDWASEASWKAGGLSHKRHRDAGKIEGSIKRLRDLDDEPEDPDFGAAKSVPSKSVDGSGAKSPNEENPSMVLRSRVRSLGDAFNQQADPKAPKMTSAVSKKASEAAMEVFDYESVPDKVVKEKKSSAKKPSRVSEVPSPSRVTRVSSLSGATRVSGVSSPSRVLSPESVKKPSVAKKSRAPVVDEEIDTAGDDKVGSSKKRARVSRVEKEEKMDVVSPPRRSGRLATHQ